MLRQRIPAGLLIRSCQHEAWYVTTYKICAVAAIIAAKTELDKLQKACLCVSGPKKYTLRPPGS